jgi:hypothetical protein
MLRACFLFLTSLVLAIGGCGQQSDAGHPWVLSVEPADGEEGVAQDAKIKINFRKSIDRNSINQNLFHLVKDEQSIYGAVSFNLDLQQATLSMTGIELEAGATYQAILEAGVLDSENNRMNEPYQWSFMVAN